MANALTAGTWTLTAQAKISGAKIDPQGTGELASIPDPLADAVAAIQQTLLFGTDSGKVDILCAAAFDIAAADDLALDLFVGTDLKNLFGGTAAFRKLKGLFIGIPSTGGGDATGVTIGDTVSMNNPVSLWFGTNVMTWTIKPSGLPMIGGEPAGVTVDATHKNLLITNNSPTAEVTVVVVLAGTSA